jgi:tRNA-splicing endonuclease subunit Sen54
MGHSAPRQLSIEGKEKTQKRLELLPEEAIYLVERGALFCWRESNRSLPIIPEMEDIQGPSMSVQEAYSEMIGREGLTLEKYQVCTIRPAIVSSGLMSCGRYLRI